MVIAFPLKTILQKPDLSGPMVNWVVELGEFNVGFQPRFAIKYRALADFVAELTQPLRTLMVNKEKCEVWEMMVDGSSNQREVEVGIILKSPHREVFEQSLKMDFRVSNNEPEYKALINRLKMSLVIRIMGIRVLTNS